MSSNLVFAEDEFTSAVDVIVAFLREAGYDGSIEAGTGIYDAVVKPNALLYSLFYQLVDRTKAYLSLQQATDMHEDGTLSDDDYDAAVDSVLSNWFVTRSEGTATSGKLRLWFSQPIDFLMFSEDDYIGTANSVSLVASSTQVFTEESFSNVVNATTEYNEYYIDVVVESSSNTDIEIEAGTSCTATVSSIYYLRATIPADFTAGKSIEDSETFIERTKLAITTRELITDAAILTVLREEFPQIDSLYVAGHSDAEQIRDIFECNGALIHYGNKADIWVCTALARESQEFTITLTDGVTSTVLSTDEMSDTCHFGHIFSVTDPDGNELPVTIEVSETEWEEPGYKPTITVDLSSLIESGEIVTYTCALVEGQEPQYGTIEFNSDGTYTYTVDSTNEEVLALIEGETLKEALLYTITDSTGNVTTKTLSITINGQDDEIAYAQLETLSNVTSAIVDVYNVTIEDGEYADTITINDEIVYSEEMVIYGTEIELDDGVIEILAYDIDTGVLEYKYTANNIEDGVVSVDLSLTIKVVYTEDSELEDLTMQATHSGTYTVVSPQLKIIAYDGLTYVVAEDETLYSGGSINESSYAETEDGVLTVVSYDEDTHIMLLNYAIQGSLANITSYSREFALEITDRDGTELETTFEVIILNGEPKIPDNVIEIDANTEEPVSGNVLEDTEEEESEDDSEEESTVDTELSSTTLTLSWLTDSTLQTIQDFVYSDDQRVACYDPQVKHKMPIVMEFQVEVTLTNYTEGSEDDVKPIIVEYIDNLRVTEGVYVESELVHYIHENLSNVSTITVPLTCTATLFDPLTCEYHTVSVNNTFDASVLYTGCSEQVSNNTVQFYTDEDLITVTATNATEEE